MALNVDGDGFLINRDDWSDEAMVELAENSGIEMTDDIRRLVGMVREMFAEDDVVPPLRTFSKADGGDRKGTHLNKLFNGAPMKKLAKLAGLPKPTGCV